MPAQPERIAFLHNHSALHIILTEKCLHQRKSLCRRDDICIRITLHKCLYAAGMIRLHMLHNQIIRLSSFELSADIFQPLRGKSAFHRIHDRNLFIYHRIGIIRHTIGYVILSLKQINFMIIHADISDVLRYMHTQSPHFPF